MYAVKTPYFEAE